MPASNGGREKFRDKRTSFTEDEEQFAFQAQGGTDDGRKIEGNPEVLRSSPCKTLDVMTRGSGFKEKSVRFRKLFHFRGQIKAAARPFSRKNQEKKEERQRFREKLARFRELVRFRRLREEVVEEEKEPPLETRRFNSNKPACREKLVLFTLLGQLRELVAKTTEKEQKIPSSGDCDREKPEIDTGAVSWDLNEKLSINASIDRKKSNTANDNSDKKEEEVSEKESFKFAKKTTLEGNPGTITESKGNVSQRSGHNVFIKPSKLTVILEQRQTFQCVTNMTDLSPAEITEDSGQSIHTQERSIPSNIPNKDEKESYHVQLMLEEESGKEINRIFQERLNFASEASHKVENGIKPNRTAAKKLEKCIHEDGIPSIQPPPKMEPSAFKKRGSNFVIKPSKLTEILEQSGTSKAFTNIADNVSETKATEDYANTPLSPQVMFTASDTKHDQDQSTEATPSIVGDSKTIKEEKLKLVQDHTLKQKSKHQSVAGTHVENQHKIKQIVEQEKNNEQSETNEGIRTANADISVLEVRKVMPLTVTVICSGNTKTRTNLSSKDITPENETINTEIVREKDTVRPSTKSSFTKEENVKKDSKTNNDNLKENEKVRNCQKSQTHKQICPKEFGNRRRTVKKEEERLLVTVTFSDYDNEQKDLCKTSMSGEGRSYNRRSSNRNAETAKEEGRTVRKTGSTRAKGRRITNLKITKVFSKENLVKSCFQERTNNTKPKTKSGKKNGSPSPESVSNNSRSCQKNVREVCKTFQGQERTHTTSVNSRKNKREKGTLIVNVMMSGDKRCQDHINMSTLEISSDQRTTNSEREDEYSTVQPTESFLAKYDNEKEHADKGDNGKSQDQNLQKTSSKKAQNKDIAKPPSESNLPRKENTNSADHVVKDRSMTGSINDAFSCSNAVRKTEVDGTYDPKIEQKPVLEPKLTVSGEHGEKRICNESCMNRTDSSLPRKTKYAEGKEFKGDQRTEVKEIYSAAEDKKNEDSNRQTDGKVHDGTFSSQKSGSIVKTSKTATKDINANDAELLSSINSLADKLATALVTDQTTPKFTREYNPIEKIFKSESSNAYEYFSQDAHATTSNKNYTSETNRTKDRKIKHKKNRPHVINYAVPKHKYPVQRLSNEVTSRRNAVRELQKILQSINPSSAQSLQSTLCKSIPDLTTEQTAKFPTEGNATRETITLETYSNDVEQTTVKVLVENPTPEQVLNTQNPDVPKGNTQEGHINLKPTGASIPRRYRTENRKIKTWTQRTHMRIASGPAWKAKQKKIIKNNTNRETEGNITERELYYLQTKALNIDSSSIKQLETTLAEAFRTSISLGSSGDNPLHCNTIQSVGSCNTTCTAVKQKNCGKKNDKAHKSKNKKKGSVDVGCQTIEQDAIELQSTSQAQGAQNKGKTKKGGDGKNKLGKNRTEESKTKKNDEQETGITIEARQTGQLSLDEERQTNQLSTDDTQVTSISTEAGQTDHLSTDDAEAASIFTKVRQTYPISRDDAQEACNLIEARQTDQLSTNNSDEATCSITTEARQTDQLSTDNAQGANISTEARQTDQLSTDDAQIASNSTEAVQTDQLSTNNSDEASITTEARQTDQLSTDNAQGASISTEARQTDQLSTDDAQAAGISTEAAKPICQLSTNSAQRISSSTDARQTDQQSIDSQEFRNNIHIAKDAHSKEELSSSSGAKVHQPDKENHSGQIMMQAETNRGEYKYLRDPNSEVTDIPKTFRDGIEDYTRESTASYHQASDYREKNDPLLIETLAARKRSTLDPRNHTIVNRRIPTQVHKNGGTDYVATELKYPNQADAIKGVLKGLNEDARSRTIDSLERRQRENKFKSDIKRKSKSAFKYCYGRCCHWPTCTSKYTGASEGEIYGHIRYPKSLLQPKHNACRYSPYFFSDYEIQSSVTNYQRPEHTAAYQKKWTMTKPSLAKSLCCAGFMLFTYSYCVLTNWIMG